MRPPIAILRTNKAQNKSEKSKKKKHRNSFRLNEKKIN